MYTLRKHLHNHDNEVEKFLVVFCIDGFDAALIKVSKNIFKKVQLWTGLLVFGSVKIHPYVI